MRSLEQFVQVRRSGAVKRYHTTPTIGEQTLAAHQWGVAIIFMYICEEPTLDGVFRALTHDAAELITGDIPSPAKRMSESLRINLLNLEARVEDRMGIAVVPGTNQFSALEQADLLDLLWYCLEQRMLGNHNMDEVFETGQKYLANHTLLPRAQEMLERIQGEWENL